MADQTINGFYTQTTIATGDLVPFYDINGATGQTSCKITKANFLTDATLTRPTVSGIITMPGGINIGNTTETLTIASGDLTITTSSGIVFIETEGGAASDDLVNILPLTAGQVIFIKNNNNARAVVVKTTGNIGVVSDITLNNNKKQIMLRGGASYWNVFSYYGG